MFRKGFIILLLSVLCVAPMYAQDNGDSDTDSLVTLISAQYAKLFEIDDVQYREVKGPAVFLHNGAYMYCDSAIWNLETDIIDAFDNIKLVHDKTVLTSDHLKYIVAEDLAEFTGDLVQLRDGDGNVFRSDNLSYNTKDSLANTNRGCAMKDKDGNVIEGTSGRYDGKAHTFSFSGDTQVFMDTLFIRSTVLRYNSDEDRVHFGRDTRMWYDDNFIKSDGGWYDKGEETVYYRMNVYFNDPDYEGWCGEAYYYRPRATVEMYSDVQVLDAEHKTILLANSAQVVIDTLTNNIDALLTQNPACVYYGENEDHEQDSLFFAADTLVYSTRQVWQISDSLFAAGNALKSGILVDAIQQAEDKAAEDYAEREKKYIESTAEYQAMQKRRTVWAQNTMDSLITAGLPVPDSVYQILGQTPPPLEKIEIPSTDSVSVAVPLDTVSVQDSTSLAFINAYYNVRIYRNKMQAKCDSLFYSDVDSVARLNGNPVIWENIKNQLTSDIMYFLLNQDGVYKGNMQQNAMIVSQEDSSHFNQIRSTEMTGHFEDNQISRFDALGGVTAIIYLSEDDVLTTMNSKDSRFMTVTMKDGEPQRLKYYEQTNSDAYPVEGLDIDKQRLKGFNWRGDERPATRQEVTPRDIFTSDRVSYSFLRQPEFPNTNKYFDNYMVDVKAGIAAAKAATEAAAETVAETATEKETGSDTENGTEPKVK